MSKEDEQSLHCAADGGDIKDEAVSNGATASTTVRTAAILLSVKDAAALSRVFRVFEVSYVYTC